jgi:hypothetical protein
MLAFNHTLYPLEISFQNISRPLKSLREEVNATARLIANTVSQPLAVAFSGGIDSEIICRSLLEQKIDFTVFIMRFIDDYNAEDIQWAFEFCSEHNIDPVVLDVDIIKFAKQDVDIYIKQGYECDKIFRYLQLWLMEQVQQQGYSLIMGGREEGIARRQKHDSPVVRYDAGHIMPHLWNSDHGKQHYPSFYETTSELMAAYFDSPVVRLVSQDANYFDLWSDGQTQCHEKILTLHHAWPEMKQRIKRDGFEKLLKFKQEQQHSLKSRWNRDLPGKDILVSQIRQQLGLDNLSKQVHIAGNSDFKDNKTVPFHIY